MATASEIAVQYSARGAKQVQRADEKVRESVQTTAQTAREEQGTVSRWMQRHQSALLAIGATTTAVMAGIIRSSPALSAVLSEVRLGFSLLAQEIGQDVAPTLRGLGDAAVELADAYDRLPDPVQSIVSHLIVFAGVAAIALSALGGLSQLIAGQALIPALQGFASWLGVSVSAVGALAAAVGLALGLFGVWVLETLGVLDAIQGLGNYVGNVLPGLIADAITVIIGIFAGPLAVIGGFILGFIEGGFQEGFRRAGQVINSFVGSASRLLGPIGDTIGDILSGLRDVAGSAWDLAISFVNDPLGTVTDILGKLEEIASNTYDTVVDVAMDVPGADKAGGVVDAAGDKLGDAAGAVGLASGGVVQSPTVAVVGEGTEDEAVAPLSKLSTMIRQAVRTEGGGGGGGTVVSVTLERGAVQLRGRPEGGTVDEQDIAEEVGQVFGERAGGRNRL